MRLARGDLRLERIAILRRTTLEDVREVDVVAIEADAREQSLEQLARLPCERRSALVFLEAGRLADEHQVGIGIAEAEDDTVAGLGQAATHTAGGFGCVGVKRGNAGEGIHETASLGAEADGSVPTAVGSWSSSSSPRAIAPPTRTVRGRTVRSPSFRRLAGEPLQDPRVARQRKC